MSSTYDLESYYNSYPFSNFCDSLKNFDSFKIATEIVNLCKSMWQKNPSIQIYSSICILHKRYDAYTNIPYRKLTQRTRLFMAVDYVFKNDSFNCLNRNLYWDILWTSIDDHTWEFSGFPDVPAMYDGAVKIHNRVSTSNPYKWEKEYPNKIPRRDPKGRIFKVNPNFEYFLPPSEKEDDTPSTGSYVSEASLRFLRDEINRLNMMSYMDTV